MITYSMLEMAEEYDSRSFHPDWATYIDTLDEDCTSLMKHYYWDWNPANVINCCFDSTKRV